MKHRDSAQNPKEEITAKIAFIFEKEDKGYWKEAEREFREKRIRLMSKFDKRSQFGKVV